MNPKDPSNKSDYDKWFAEEVQAALQEADNPNTEWIPHEHIAQEIATERSRIENLLSAQRRNKKK